jgi:hypothetical protein
MEKKYNHKDFIKEMEEKQFDIFLTSSSFENRCFIVPKLLHQIALKKVIIFYNTNEVKEIIVNAENLVQIFQQNSVGVKLNSDNPIANFSIILEQIESLLKNYTKPNILIDTTTFTHETLLILLKILELKHISLGEISISYTGALAYSVNEIENSKKWLSKGIKEIRTVLGYSGFTDPTAINHLIILFGFESERTKQIIEEYEYDFISLGFGKIDESIQSDHQKLNCERHKKLLEDYPNAKEFSFSLVNPFDAKKDILAYISKEEFKNFNTVIAPLNNKLSTIGACLAALSNEDIQLAYAQPLVYNTKGYSVPNDDIYFYPLNFDSK